MVTTILLLEKMSSANNNTRLIEALLLANTKLPNTKDASTNTEPVVEARRPRIGVAGPRGATGEPITRGRSRGRVLLSILNISERSKYPFSYMNFLREFYYVSNNFTIYYNIRMNTCIYISFLTFKH